MSCVRNPSASSHIMLESFLVSTAIVAIAEVGDKTQLLAFILAARYRKPLPIIAGILFATIANHLLAAAVGHHAAMLFSEQTLYWILAASFLLIALWTLIPDKMDDQGLASKYGPFVTSLVAFFVAEMADKTQIATVALAAQYPYFLLVVLGTTLGMMLANVPVVLIGNFATDRLPLRMIRALAALGFLALAIYSAIKAIL